MKFINSVIIVVVVIVIVINIQQTGIKPTLGTF